MKIRDFLKRHDTYRNRWLVALPIILLAPVLYALAFYNVLSLKVPASYCISLAVGMVYLLYHLPGWGGE